MLIVQCVQEYLMISLAVLVNVAFLTLLERKILGMSQSRVGPNKVGAWGVLQPAADAVKLFSKSISVLGPMNKLIFFLSPVLSLILALMFVMLISPLPGGLSYSLGVLVLLMLFSLNVYPLLGAGWSSNSKYALLGGLRGVAQTIAYEISLSFLLLSIMFAWGGVSFKGVGSAGESSSLLTTLTPLFFVWSVVCVAELNRTPFDFAEGESELVSGFNVEYGAVKFAMVFMAEYGMIYFLSIFSAFLFIFSSGPGGLSLVGGVGLAAVVVWLRVTLPRFRYDLLMGLTWKHLLPCSLGACLISASLGAVFLG